MITLTLRKEKYAILIFTHANIRSIRILQCCVLTLKKDISRWEIEKGYV